jgi:multidrug efflux pump subunit AcrB
LAIAVFAGSIYMTRFIVRVVPPEDQGRFLVRLEAPIDYSVEEVNRLFSKARPSCARPGGRCRQLPSRHGTGGSGQVNKGVMMVSLKEKAKRQRSQG